MIEQTLCIIKPDAVKRNLEGEILAKIQTAGFKIIGLRKMRLSKKQAEMFYSVHQARSFFGELVTYMSSGPSVAVALLKENGVEEFRELLGATDPADADSGTLRHEFGISKEANACHGSDCLKNGKAEIRFFFSAIELS